MMRPLPCSATMSTAGIRFIDRPMTEADIPAVLAMEREACPQALHAWSEDNYRSSIRAGYWLRVRCLGDVGGSEGARGHIVAVCVAMDGLDEVHLLNIAVDHGLQRQGVAADLLHRLMARCQQQGVHSLWLEVRPSNVGARALYRREGFVEVGVRRGYYPAEQGREDALVMRCEIQPADPDHAAGLGEPAVPGKASQRGEAGHALD